jgi:hypothetical protein
MTKQTLKYFALLLACPGLALSAASSLSQGKRVGLGRMGPRHSSHAVVRSGPTPPPGSASYTFTFFGFPQAPYTVTSSINLGATTPKIEIVGTYGPNLVGYGSGFLLQASESKGTINEAYTPVNFPGYALQEANGINDSEEIVGTYIDNDNNFQGYLLSGGVFTPIQVPFAGADSTLPQGINNSGEVVGIWEEDNNTVYQSFALNGGVYSTLGYPGAAETQAISNNNKGDITGYYSDSAGAYHGFLLSGGTYTSIDVPGAVGTFAYGINDAGNIVGVYCITNECITNYNAGSQGFLLSGGVFTTINVPNASATDLGNINDRGVIVGWYYDCADAQLGFVATP